ncbi:pectate lyase [Colletotrichum tofieldiae]|uniref:Pectate lyase n=1 Tax=Colletotrichum tofieldiae TaxID=708197 RepID=A0A166Y3X6_9PEZI|nr:pectate lyase [Colletotrichum tofieldiae]GKT53973.1 pectate lyase [Colletotrichum tofieldiae]GKT73708.1 pectate lyase [Colletotrichum tofieldiae]
MKYSFAVALSTLVLGITAAPAANGAAQGNAIAHAERGYFDFLHHAARAEKPSKTRSAKGPKKTKPSKTRKPGSIITSAPGAPGNGTSGFEVRASNGTAPAAGGLPASSGTSVLKAAQTVAAGQSFDGGMVAFDRGVSCTGQAEGGDSDAVFILEKGAKLSNVIIGPNQIEGVHCNGGCSLDNVWWSAVCEDAFTIKKQEAGETTTITSGGAFGAEDKVLQHNGAGTLSVSGFTVETFGKLYRSCGNCKTMYERHVIFDSINASSGKLLAGINSNYGDTATFKNVVAKGVSEVCTEFKGNDSGDEPTEISSGPSTFCKYSTSDVTSS